MTPSKHRKAARERAKKPTNPSQHIIMASPRTPLKLRGASPHPPHLPFPCAPVQRSAAHARCSVHVCFCRRQCVHNLHPAAPAGPMEGCAAHATGFVHICPCGHTNAHKQGPIVPYWKAWNTWQEVACHAWY